MDKTLENNATLAWVQLHRAHRRLLEQVENSLKQQDLPPLDWYDVLLELDRAKPGGLRQYEIGDKVLLSKHNLSRLLDRLEQKGLLARYTCAEDGRGNLIRITAAGKGLLKQVWPVYRQIIQESFASKLGAEDLRQLQRILGKVV